MAAILVGAGFGLQKLSIVQYGNMFDNRGPFYAICFFSFDIIFEITSSHFRAFCSDSGM